MDNNKDQNDKNKDDKGAENVHTNSTGASCSQMENQAAAVQRHMERPTAKRGRRPQDAPGARTHTEDNYIKSNEHETFERTSKTLRWVNNTSLSYLVFRARYPRIF